MNILENSLPPLSERPPAFPGGLRRISEGEAAELRMAGQENRESLARRRKPGTFHCAVPKVFWHAVCILNRKPRHIFQTLLHSLPKDRRLPRRSFSSVSDRQDSGKPSHVPTCQAIVPRLHQTIASRTRLISPGGLLNFLSVRVYLSDGTAHGLLPEQFRDFPRTSHAGGTKKKPPCP